MRQVHETAQYQSLWLCPSNIQLSLERQYASHVLVESLAYCAVVELPGPSFRRSTIADLQTEGIYVCVWP